jgi:hypothetical protein
VCLRDKHASQGAIREKLGVVDHGCFLLWCVERSERERVELIKRGKIGNG